MTRWGEFRDNLRTDIHENPDAPRITNDLLYLYFRWAMFDYSTYNPRILEYQYQLDNQDSIELPPDVLGVREVHIPQGRLLEELHKREGWRYKQIGFLAIYQSVRPVQYWVTNNRLYFNQPSNEVLYMVYTANHLIPDNVNEVNATLTFPDRDERAIGLFIKAQNSVSLRTRQSQLDRYKDKNLSGHTRTDNPMTPEANNLMKEYYDLMNRYYTSTGSIYLYRPGRGQG